MLPRDIDGQAVDNAFAEGVIPIEAIIHSQYWSLKRIPVRALTKHSRNAATRDKWENAWIPSPGQKAKRPNSDSAEPDTRPSVQSPSPLQTCHSLSLNYDQGTYLFKFQAHRALSPGGTCTEPAGSNGGSPEPHGWAELQNHIREGAFPTCAFRTACQGHVRHLHPLDPGRCPPN